MTVGVFLVDTKTLDSMAGYLCAKAMVRSVREHMPGVEVVHFTDDRSPKIEGVDAVRRLPSGPMAQLRMQHHAEVDGPWLFVDTDVLFQRDVRDVFRKPFDIAIAERDWDHLKPASGFTKRMPYNMGVVFSRSSMFWMEVCERLAGRSKDARRWMGDQEVVCELIAQDAYSVRLLPGSVYNFPPPLDESDADRRLESNAAIVHFKGPHRKPMMLARIGEPLVCV